MTNSNKLKIMSVILNDSHMMLVTNTGTVKHISNMQGYDILKLVQDFTAAKAVNFSEPVELDIRDYLTASTVLADPDGVVTVENTGSEEDEAGSATSIRIKHQDKEMKLPKSEGLTAQIERASETNSPGVLNFLKRLAPVLAERQHSAEDLMDFIASADLPVTDDGHIIAYKLVYTHSRPGYYTDCHSGRVVQRIGSRVSMNPEEVNSDRNVSCSTGLHVANLGYLAGFIGNAILIVKVDPANFITVPHREVHKARVSSYDIVGTVDDETFGMLKNSVYSTSASFEDTIANIVKGKHPQPIEEVIIGNKSKDIEYRILKVTVPDQLPNTVSTTSGRSLKTPATGSANKVANAKATVRKGKVTVAFRKLFDAWTRDRSQTNITALINFKRSKKKGLEALGLTPEEAKTVAPFMK